MKPIKQAEAGVTKAVEAILPEGTVVIPQPPAGKFLSLALRQPAAAGSGKRLLVDFARQEGGPRMARRNAKAKKKRPAFAGRQAKKLKGVFGAGALLPQFLAELTDTLNSQICTQYSMLVPSWQA